MDKEHLDHLKDQAAVRPTEPAKTGPEPALASQMGNRAFTSLVQRSAKSQGAGPLDPEIADSIKAEKGGGRALDDGTRSDMEGHLGADLSGVRVHTGSQADSLNRSVQAEAFTTGNDVFFKSGKYAPETSDGRGLLAHELTHVVQQNSGRVGGGSRVSDPGDTHEVEAKSVGAAVAASPAGPVDRQEEEEEEMQMSVDRQEEEEEEMQMSVDRREEEEEEMQA
jgi:Domain of unknown function (DUF4157)